MTGHAGRSSSCGPRSAARSGGPRRAGPRSVARRSGSSASARRAFAASVSACAARCRRRVSASTGIECSMRLAISLSSRPGSSIQDASARSSYICPRWPCSARKVRSASTNASALSSAASSSRVTPCWRTSRSTAIDSAAIAARRSSPRSTSCSSWTPPPISPSASPGAGPGHDRLVQVGQVVEDLVRPADRVEVDRPRPADPPPHLVPGLGQVGGGGRLDRTRRHPVVDLGEFAHGASPVGVRPRDRRPARFRVALIGRVALGLGVVVARGEVRVAVPDPGQHLVRHGQALVAVGEPGAHQDVVVARTAA